MVLLRRLKSCNDHNEDQFDKQETLRQVAFGQSITDLAKLESD